MSLNNLIFIHNLPKLDIHGIDSASAEMYINDFIEENYQLRQKYCLIVHGIGKLILKKTTKKVLSSHKLVEDYKIWFFNSGCTVIELKIKGEMG